MSVEEARIKQEPETELGSNEAPDILYTYQEPIKLEIELEKEAVKSEPPCESVSSMKDEAGLYIEHVIKDERVLGPERVQSLGAGAPSITSTTSAETCEPQKASTSDQTTTHNTPPFTVKHKTTTHPSASIYLRESKYVCDICQKVLARKDLLRIHKRTHTGEKPYSCDVCNRDFAQLAHLKVHAMIHTGAKPYSCDICSMGFRQMSSLKRHERTHAGEKPHGCSVCGKWFTRKGHLVKHTLTRHQRS